MHVVKAIAGRIFALWALLSFIATFLVFFIPSMLTWFFPEPGSQRVFIGIAKLWMNIWLRMVGCPVRVKGREHFRKGSACIVVCNHNSLMDVPLSSPFIPGANKTIAKTSFASVPLFGWYYRKGAVLVDRKSEKSRKQSYDKMKAVLQKGMHMCIYPEGTRNRSAEPLKKFHDGAFRLAVTTGAAIIPAVIFHTKNVLPANRFFFFWPQRLQLHFLAPVSPEGQTTESLRDVVFNRMMDYYTGSSLKNS